MTDRLFQLLQICDSNFPSGTFSHSFGLETYIQEDKMTDKESFLYALKQYVYSQCIYTDGLACRLAYEAIQENQFQKVWELDQALYALSAAKETREGNKRIGRQLAKVMDALYDIELLQLYESKIKQKERYGHSAIVFAIVCEALEIDLETTLSVYLFTTISSLIQNGVRGIPLGQTDGQKILLEMQPFLRKQAEMILHTKEEDFGGCVPGLEIAQMRHEQLSVRLFMS